MKSLCKKIQSFLIIPILVFCILVPYADTAKAQTSYQKSLSSIVQKYEAGTGYFTLTKDSRFYIVSDSKPDSALKTTVKLVAGEFAKAGYPASENCRWCTGAKRKLTAEIL